MNDLDQWLVDQQQVLDALIADGCRATFDRHPEWSAFELDQSLQDIWQLSRGGDCCYDRPSVGPTYALWYHGRRTLDMVRLLRSWCNTPTEEVWSIIDLGCGSGATLWACGLLTAGMHACGCPQVPSIDLHAVDASPFMKRQAEDLWALLRQRYRVASEKVSVTFRCDTWVRTSIATRARPRIVASYLLDHSDKRRVPEIARSLANLAERHKAGRVLLAAAKPKAELLAAALGEFYSKHWERVPAANANGRIWTGDLTRCHDVRSKLYEQRLARDPQRWQAAPMWTAGGECIAQELRSAKPVQEGLFGSPDPPQRFLDPEQENAAAPDSRAAIILGAAGSGKSVVLAKRIARTLLDRSNGHAANILVTSFNKRMIDQLAEWIQEELPPGWTLSRMKQSESEANPQEFSCGWWVLQAPPNETRRLTLMNWDLVPTKLFHVTNVKVAVKEELDADVRSAIQEVRAKRNLGPGEHDEILAPSFLTAERHRVVFGLGAISTKPYIHEVDRVGRGRPLNKSQRLIVAEAMLLIKRMMIQRRIVALRRVRRIPDPGYLPDIPVATFSHAFVDECQDFTPSDFELLHALTGGNESVIAAGDLTQSMRLGPSHRVPSLPSGKRWKSHPLRGSYRLPLRVCEAILPLATAVGRKHKGQHKASTDEDAVLPESRKAAVLGVRPIVIRSADCQACARQIVDIWRLYGEPHGADRITIAEEDAELGRELTQVAGSVSIELQSMNRIKGLERPFVVWSTRIPVDADESVEEWAFTILSRTTSILVIAVGPDTTPEFAHIVRRLLDRDRLLPWTEEAADWLEDVSCPPVSPPSE